MAASRPEKHQTDRPSELRCKCHRLLACVENNTVILRCPRCKKRAVLSLDVSSPAREVEVRFVF
jgi:Zn finger protein HypA/HybF involved in hydrogenase expression